MRSLASGGVKCSVGETGETSVRGDRGFIGIIEGIRIVFIDLFAVSGARRGNGLNGNQPSREDLNTNYVFSAR